MAGYLRRYIGTYRVLAEYDRDTGDWVRNRDGNIDPTFDDYYIPCKDGGIVTHMQGQVLMYYCSHKRRKSFKNVVSDYAFDYTVTDSETSFLFYAKDFEKLAEIIGPKTRGKGLSPFSTKNLPYQKYTIPENDLQQLKEISALIPKDNILVLSRLNSQFCNDVVSKIKEDYAVDMRKQGLRRREYIHSLGLWNEYIKFLKEGLK